MYNDIVVPTDGSKESLETVKKAVELSGKGAAVHALYVINTKNVLGDMDWSPIRDELMRHAQEAVQEVTKKAKNLDDRERQNNVATIEEIREGEPGEEIIDYANEIDADIIVMGKKGKSGLEKTVLGSTTEKVVRMSEIPVLVNPE